MARPTLFTTYFNLTGINRKMFDQFCDLDSDYSDSEMSNLMYERFAGAYLENADWSNEEVIQYINDLLHEFAMYGEEGVERFILHNTDYCMGFKIEVICSDFENIWDNTIVHISYIKTPAE